MNDELKALMGEAMAEAEGLMGETWTFDGQSWFAVVAQGSPDIGMILPGYVSTQSFTLKATLAQFGGTPPALIEKKSKITLRGMTLLVDS